MNVEAQQSSLEFRYSSLPVATAGEGPTIGYLHGLLGNIVTDEIVGELAGAGFRVVAPSLPGFTGAPACRDLRSLHDWVVAASEVLDLAGLTGKPLVAASTGAMLALELAAIRPEAFEQLVLIAPHGLWSDEEPAADLFANTMSAQKRLLVEDQAKIARFYEDEDVSDPHVLVERSVGRYRARAAAASLLWPIAEFGLATRLHRVSCPVTLIWGAEDALVPPGYMSRFAKALPNLKGEYLISGAGHLADIDKSAEVAAIVKRTLG